MHKTRRDEGLKKPISFSFYGSTKTVWLNPHILTRSLLAQKILLSIRKKAKSSTEISREVEVERTYVADELDWLSKNDLVKRSKAKWIANFILISEEEKKPLMNLARQVSHEVASGIRDQLTNLKDKFSTCTFIEQDFSWNQMSYIILAALTLDLGVNHSLHKENMVPPPPRRPDGGAWYFWGLESGDCSKRQFGVNSDYDERSGTAHIWSPNMEKPTTAPFAREERKLMIALADKPLTIEEVGDAIGTKAELITELTKDLSKHGYLTEDKGKFKLHFPIFTPKDLQAVIPTISQLSDSIVQEIIKPKEATFGNIFKKLDRLESEYGGFLCMLYHMIMNHSLDRLVEGKMLPEMPKKAPTTWGFWGWIGKLEILRI